MEDDLDEDNEDMGEFGEQSALCTSTRLVQMWILSTNATRGRKPML
jgi:hypothetical protein